MNSYVMIYPLHLEPLTNSWSLTSLTSIKPPAVRVHCTLYFSLCETVSSLKSSIHKETNEQRNIESVAVEEVLESILIMNVQVNCVWSFARMSGKKI